MSLQKTDPQAGAVSVQVSPLQLTPQAIEMIKGNLLLCEELVNDVLEPGVDFGKVEGVERPFLWDPGAAKIAAAFNTYPTHVILKETLEADFVCYVIEAQLVSRVSKEVVATGIGGASTWETKYKYRWVKKPEEWGWKGEGLKFNAKTNKYRIPNPEHGELVNTILKMAAKRAEVDAAESLPGVGSALRKLFGMEEVGGGEADWTWFWTRMRAMGLDANQVHTRLGVKSMKDWFGQGKTLKDAVELLARGQAPENSSESSTIFEERVIERDVSLIKTKTDFYNACFQDFQLQPKEALQRTGLSSEMDVPDWPTAYMQICGSMGAKVVTPST